MYVFRRYRSPFSEGLVMTGTYMVTILPALWRTKLSDLCIFGYLCHWIKQTLLFTNAYVLVYVCVQEVQKKIYRGISGTRHIMVTISSCFVEELNFRSLYLVIFVMNKAKHIAFLQCILSCVCLCSGGTKENFQRISGTRHIMVTISSCFVEELDFQISVLGYLRHE